MADPTAEIKTPPSNKPATPPAETGTPNSLLEAAKHTARVELYAKLKGMNPKSAEAQKILTAIEKDKEALGRAFSREFSDRRIPDTGARMPEGMRYRNYGTREESHRDISRQDVYVGADGTTYEPSRNTGSGRSYSEEDTMIVRNPQREKIAEISFNSRDIAGRSAPNELTVLRYEDDAVVSKGKIGEVNYDKSSWGEYETTVEVDDGFDPIAEAQTHFDGFKTAHKMAPDEKVAA